MQFLTLPEVLEIHRDQIARHGGMPGVRDLGLLQSPLAMPSATFGGKFLHEDVDAMAAAYLFHLVQNHPFCDGNKRVGVVAALVFLLLNGRDFRAPEDDLADMVLRVASGKADKATVIRFVRKWSAE